MSDSEIPLEIESYEIYARPRLLEPNWHLEISHGVKIKNQTLKVGDEVHDLQNKSYGRVLEIDATEGFAQHAILRKNDDNWVISSVVHFDLEKPMFLTML